MGWAFYDISTLPNPGDIVWCKWPLREKPGQPGDSARPVLVRATYIQREQRTQTTYGSIIVSYGTGKTEKLDTEKDLIIGSMKRAREMGLHKPTGFSLDPRNKKHLIWCEEYFISQEYVRSQRILIGSLGKSELDTMEQCLKSRGLL